MSAINLVDAFDTEVDPLEALRAKKLSLEKEINKVTRRDTRQMGQFQWEEHDRWLRGLKLDLNLLNMQINNL